MTKTTPDRWQCRAFAWLRWCPLCRFDRWSKQRARVRFAPDPTEQESTRVRCGRCRFRTWALGDPPWSCPVCGAEMLADWIG